MFEHGLLHVYSGAVVSAAVLCRLRVSSSPSIPPSSTLGPLTPPQGVCSAVEGSASKDFVSNLRIKKTKLFVMVAFD